METPLDRVLARVAAAEAAVPVAPMVMDPEAPDTAAEISDLNATVAELAERIGVLEAAAVDDVMDGLDAYAEVAALPEVPEEVPAEV